MGGKQRGEGRRLLLSVAGVMLLLAACAPGVQPHIEAGRTCPEAALTEKPERLTTLSRFIGRGDFEGALQANQRALAESPKSPPGDEALMNLGLLYVHYANPKRDYRKALVYFRRLGREFPASPLAEEANIWAGVLTAFEKAERVDIEIEEKKKELVK